MTLTGNWTYPTAIRFGAGRIKELPAACAEAGITRPLLVTDRGLAELPITAAALDILEASGLGRGLFAEVDPNPNERNLTAGIEAFRAGGHDGVVAFGGGSGLDLGKMVAFMSGQTRPVWDFEDIDDWWTRADADAIAPIVAVPTTAGTGSEVGRASVITNAKDNGVQPLGVEGENGSDWVLVDLGGVVVHVMMPDTRALYDLERLWSDLPSDAPASEEEAKA